MMKIFFIVFTSLILTLHAKENENSLNLLVDGNKLPKIELVQLLECAGLESTKVSLDEMNDWAQAHLLRRGERWDMQSEQYEPLKQAIYPLLCKLGFIQERSPCFTNYEGAIVHGARLSLLLLRLNYLCKQWEEGVRFYQLYFLSGERPLDPIHEKRDSFNTEIEMIQWIWDHTEVPEEMRSKVKVYFVNASLNKDSLSQKIYRAQADLPACGIRPTTEDTIKAWLECKPSYGCYLAVSNAPYTNRQDIILRRLAPPNYCFDTIGPGIGSQEKIAIVLDEVARCIFEAARQD